MPSPITAADFDLQNLSGNVCERLRKLLEINDTLRTFFAWMFDDDGNVRSEFKLLIQDIATPIGAVIWRPISTIPDGYLLANGQAVSRTDYANLFAVYGTTFGAGDGSSTFNVVNLSGLFVRGSGPGGANGVGSTGGAATVTLDITEIPAHSHPPKTGFDDFSGFVSVGQPSSFEILGGSELNRMDVTGEAGGGQAHENLPPYRTGHWLIKT